MIQTTIVVENNKHFSFKNRFDMKISKKAPKSTLLLGD